ncbi:pirin family protein [Plantactinospora siamensis]|uniref:Pirin family protein n=1 Tax=Plantactinospora siamensis TaxID=555372 RepID=A0ABV6P213_9ACTN
MTAPLAARRIDRVSTKQRLGPDAQVDDKALLISPADPTRTDPFLLLSEDWFSEPGFEWHPHRGLETVTTVLDGVLEHGDNLGNAGALEPGDVQWMTAGRGIIHRELAFRNEHAHTLQLWLNLPARHKMAATRYQDLLAARRPRITLPGVVVDVISGTVAGITGPALNHHPVQGALVTLEPGTAYRLPVPASHRAFAYVVEGAVSVAGRRVRAGQTAWSDPVRGAADAPLPLAAGDGHSPARVLVFSGRPLREPIAMGGPFVMNRRTEITQAFADFHAGRFGPVPRQARLKYDR